MVYEKVNATTAFPAKSLTLFVTVTEYDVSAFWLLAAITTVEPEQLFTKYASSVSELVTVILAVVEGAFATLTVEQSIFALNFIVISVSGAAPSAGVVDGTVVATGVGGVTGAVIATLTEPDFPPVLAVICADVSDVTVGAVNFAVAMPFVVWLNGSIPPMVVVKFTVVPSGARVPAVVVAFAVIVDVPADATLDGLAETSTLPMDIGAKVNDTILKAPLAAKAVTLIVVGRDVNVNGTTFTITAA